jgi:hypothetical protein
MNALAENSEYERIKGPYKAEGLTSALINATPFIYRNPAEIPKREWLYGFHLLRKFIAILAAAGGVGKSALSIAEALAMASNKALLHDAPATGELRVWIINLEDPLEETERRIAAAMQAHGIEPHEIAGRLFVDSGRTQPLCIATTGKDGTIVSEPLVDAIVDEILAKRIDVLIVDPFVSSHAVPENDNGAIDAVAKAWCRVAERANCAVELIHHIRKSGSEEVTAESSRGAGALVAASRTTRVLQRMTKDEATKAGVENNRSHFRVTRDKANLSPPAENSSWFCLESVDLPNGDSVGVVKAWRWPDPFADITAADLLAVQKAIDGKSYRANVQAKEWIGHAVADILGMDSSDPAAKSKIKALVKAWIETGALRETEAEDKSRHMRPVVVVGNWAIA